MRTAAQVSAAASAGNQAPTDDIVDAAVAAGDLTLLFTAVKAVDLGYTLKGNAKPFHVLKYTSSPVGGND